MAKIKGFSGKLRCGNGELYRFVKGYAEVPGLWFKNKRVKITVVEFKQLQLQ